MKLKRLLPIASVASVAAVVAPIVTSCGMQTYTFTGDDFKTTFKPENQATAKEIYEYQATEEYLTAVKNNKKILAEDIMFYIVNKQGTEYLSDIEKINMSVGDINVAKCTISYKIDFVYKENYVIDNGAVLSFEVKNMPYAVFINYEHPEHWSFAPMYIVYGSLTDAVVWLMGFPGWSISLTVKFLNNTMKWNVSPKEDPVKIDYVVRYATSYMDMIADANAYLYYLDNITIKEPVVK